MLFLFGYLYSKVWRVQRDYFSVFLTRNLLLQL